MAIMPGSSLHARLALLACCAAAACGPDPTREATGVPPLLTHDYGTVPHGQARDHQFVVDVAGVLGPGWLPLATQLDCSCARAQMSVRGANGAVQAIDAAHPAAALQADERLLLTLRLDTALKEAADLGPVVSRGTLVLQRADSARATARVQWPIRFHFAIDAPVQLRPFSVLDFERVPVSRPGRLVITMASDLPDQPIAFGPVRCDDPRVGLELQERENMTLLRATFTPTERTGSFRALVTVDTDLASGYQIELAAVGKIVPDLEAIPMPKLSLRTDMSRAQPESAETSQYLLVTDHDRRRPAEFLVARIVDTSGRDASSSFAVRFEAIAGDERSRRMYVRYTGGHDGEFRGQLVLAKDPDDGPFLSIELVALHIPGHRRQP